MKQESWIDAEALQAAARASGTPVTSRQLELWRYRGLLPRPTREKGGRARWLYPPGTREQLLRLLHWRDRAPSLDLVRIGLWIDGFAIGLPGVRTSLLSFVDAWTSMLERERSQNTEDQAATVDALARRFAGMRSRAPVPHAVRMTLADRTRAYGYMVAVMFNMKEEVERRRGDAALLERMLGLRSGHSGGLSAAIALDDVSDQIARLPAPDMAARVIAEASEDEYEFVRSLVQVMTIWTPLLIPLLLDEGSAKAQPFATILRAFFSEIPPGFYPLVLCALLVSLHAKGPDPTELRTHVATLASGVVDVDLLNELPAGTRREAFDKLPERTKADVVDELHRRRNSPAQQSAAAAQHAAHVSPEAGKNERHNRGRTPPTDRELPRSSPNS
jgi:hypothetical protein